MVIEAFAITSFVTLTGFAASTVRLVLFLLLLEYVEHLLGIHLGKARVEHPDALALRVAWVGDILLGRVHVVEHQVDDMVTSHISHAPVALPQLAPDKQVPQRLVQVLMQDDEA